MKRLAFVMAWAALVGALLSACNDVGNCQGQSVKPGGACTGDQLECAYTLDTPSPACDGTIVEGGLQTSCLCQGGTWSCPSPVSCDAASTPETSTDAPADAATEAVPSDGPSTSDGSRDGSGDASGE